MESQLEKMLENLVDPASLLRWWFAPGIKPLWFQRGDSFDVEVRSRLGPLHERAMAGEIDGWAGNPNGLLALVILFDQVPRNSHRGTPLAFATDAKALALARLAVDRGLDGSFETDERLFLYLPFEHSEQLADQERSVALFRALGDAKYLDFAIRHHDVIARFGRFPQITQPDVWKFVGGPFKHPGCSS